MASKKSKDGALTADEKKVVKSLLGRSWRNQDIQALVNLNRAATVNSARITEVKSNDKQKPASKAETDFYIARKNSYDPKTGLNFYDDERLIRAREAMLLAVQVFNSPTALFKAEMYAVLANISWTYLIHEYIERSGGSITKKNGETHSLSTLLARPAVPLSQAVKKNLAALKEIRDAVEHRLMRRSDYKWAALFQACCLNFDRAIVEMFGERTSLRNELSLALQFAKLELDQIASFQSYDLPEYIEALDAQLDQKLTDADKSNPEYRLKVVYTYDSSSKSEAHVNFVNPTSAEGLKIKNILVKNKTADETHPHKRDYVVQEVAKLSEQKFTSYNHTQAWKLYKVRPKSGSAKPEKTDNKYCHYSKTFNSYTYSKAWIEFLVSELQDEKQREKIYSAKM